MITIHFRASPSTSRGATARAAAAKAGGEIVYVGVAALTVIL